MLLDFEDYRPEAPRMLAPISAREAVLISFVLHLILVILYLVAPKSFFEAPTEVVQLAPQDQQPLRFVEMRPPKDLAAMPKLPAVQSDMDRRSSTIERAPQPENNAPVARGNTPEPVVGAPAERSVAAGQPEPPAPPTPDAAPPLPANPRSSLAMPSNRPSEPAVARRSPGNMGDAFRNLDQYLRDDTFDNRRGGKTEQSADFQFDSMGVDFGPWLLRLKHQVERNWIVPRAVESYVGRVVIRFGVLRNGTIVGLNVLSPGPIPALTQSAVTALKLSNPTAALPAEYPVEPFIITVTFHYNEFPLYGQ
jgi:outer membrane biosynthesis protein TonB